MGADLIRNRGKGRRGFAGVESGWTWSGGGRQGGG